ncbi:MAG TPA: ferritin-like domain-containing protein [Burkholderiales bacterium]|nr:ferritin-like domain-containing protein [Burkholderiales bacterium]
MKKEVRIGKNRTGIAMSPGDSKELLQGSERGMPTSEGDVGALAAIRGQYIMEADPIGSVPPPSTVKGVFKAGAEMLTGNRAEVLLDKLGQRLAFERGGTRLYEGLIMKCLAAQAGRDVIELAKLEQIHGEEARHFELVRRAIEQLGGDPTAMTPCADVTGVQALGLVQTITDPRTSLAQCVETVLIAELTDNAGWELLIRLAQEMGHDELVQQFQQAHLHEQRHLVTVKSWLEQLTLKEASLLPA